MRALSIPEDELSVLDVFSRHQVEYLLIGGYAMRFHGSDRDVDDVDVWTGNAEANASRLFKAITELIGRAPAFPETELRMPKKKVSFRNDGYEIDLLTSVHGLDFSDAFERRLFASQAGVELPVVAREDLLVIKETVARRDPQRLKLESRDVAFLRSLPEQGRSTDG